MRAVVQLVKESHITINNKLYSQINRGLLILLGISINDNDSDIDYIIDKIINLRVFKDQDDKMNKSILDEKGEILIVSQFTLYGDARKGRRPSYSNAANGKVAENIYNKFIIKLKERYSYNNINTGLFGAMMEVFLVNDGPVTILLDSEKIF